MTTMSTVKTRGRLGRTETRQALGFITPALAGLTLFTIVPVLLSIVMSLFNWPAFGERSFAGVANYVTLFTEDPNFWPALRNSLVFALLYVPLNLILSLGLALALGPRIRGRGAFRVLFFIPVVTPIVANVLVWKMLLQPQGLFNGISTSVFGVELPNFLADQNWAMIMVVVMSVWQGLGYNMLIFSAAPGRCAPLWELTTHCRREPWFPSSCRRDSSAPCVSPGRHCWRRTITAPTPSAGSWRPSWRWPCSSCPSALNIVQRWHYLPGR